MKNQAYKDQYKKWRDSPPDAVIERVTAIANFTHSMCFDNEGKKIPFHLLPHQVHLAVKKVHNTGTNYMIEPYDLTPALERIATIMAHDVDKKRLLEITPKGSQEEIDKTLHVTDGS